MAELTAQPPTRVYARLMGRHDADPAGTSHYAGMVLLTAAVLVLLVVGALALLALSHR